MEPRHVPDLARKLELLRRHGPRRSWSGIADALNVSPKTIRWWIDGDSTRDPELVPEKRFEAILALFAEALRGTVSRKDAERLVLGDAVALERAFTERAGVVLHELIAAEGKIGTARLRRAGPLGLVERDMGPTDHPRVRLDERFLVEYRTSRSGYVLAVQHAQQQWGVIPFADDRVSPHQRVGPLLVPGLRDGKFVFLYETTSVGTHRFLLFVAPEMFPIEVRRAAANGKSLDGSDLSLLAQFHARQPAHLRELHVFHLDVVRA